MDKKKKRDLLQMKLNKEQKGMTFRGYVLSRHISKENGMKELIKRREEFLRGEDEEFFDVLRKSKKNADID